MMCDCGITYVQMGQKEDEISSRNCCEVPVGFHAFNKVADRDRAVCVCERI